MRADDWRDMRDDELAHWRDHYATRVALADEEITTGLPALTADDGRAIRPALLALIRARGLDVAVSADELRETTVAFCRSRVAAADRERSRRLRTAHLRVTTGLPQYPRDWLADLKRRVNLDGVLEHETGIALGPRSVAGQRRGPCPFCGSRGAALAVYLADPDDEHFRCYRCGAHGDAIGAIGLIYGVPFRAAVELLAARCGMPPPAGPAPPAPPPPDRFLLLARELDGDHA